jgi:hypothetical protein
MHPRRDAFRYCDAKEYLTGISSLTLTALPGPAGAQSCGALHSDETITARQMLDYEARYEYDTLADLLQER